MNPALSDRWLEIAAGGSTAQLRKLERGRPGAGRLVEALRIQPGAVRVRVPDGRGRSYDVTVRVPPFTSAQWEEAVDRVGSRLRHTAALLEGLLPEILLADDFVFPDRAEATCTCSQPRPCRHIASAQHAIAAALDRDPLRLLRIRGRSSEELRDAVRAGRADDHAAEAAQGLDLSEPFDARADVEAIDVHPVPEPDVTSVFEQLGPPPGIEDPQALVGLMRDAAAMAWRLAAGEGTEVADDEALLTELRAQGIATAASIAGSLGLDPGVAQEALDRLYGEGQVLRMGSGDGARYRAA